MSPSQHVVLKQNDNSLEGIFTSKSNILKYLMSKNSSDGWKDFSN